MVNYHTFEMARDYNQRGMSAYTVLQNSEFAAEADGYTATKHQREVGTAYFDRVLNTISGGLASTSALAGSTEAEQFQNQNEPRIERQPPKQNQIQKPFVSVDK
jgi:isocitrate lyase